MSVYDITGSFFCQCPDGFEMDQQGHCRDVDECKLAEFYGCGLTGQVCVNTVGSFYCECEEAWAGGGGAGDGRCLSSELENDGINTSCRLVGGEPVCECAQGFELGSSLQICEGEWWLFILVL